MCGWVGDEKCLAALRGGHAEKWCVCVCVCDEFGGGGGGYSGVVCNIMTVM